MLPVSIVMAPEPKTARRFQPAIPAVVQAR
jgi:hypothetical protein